MFQTLGDLRQEIRQVIDPLIFRVRKGLNLISGAVVGVQGEVNSVRNDLDEYPDPDDIVVLVSGEVPKDQISSDYIQWAAHWNEGDYILQTAGINPIRASPANFTLEAPYAKINLKHWLHKGSYITISGDTTIGSGTVNVWGTPSQGNVPVWNSSLGWWVPDSVSGGATGSVDWINVTNKPTNIVYINDTPNHGESIIWDSTSSSWIAMFNDWSSITNIPANIVYINDTPISGESIIWDGSQWITEYISSSSVEWSNILNKPDNFVFSSDTPLSGEYLYSDGSNWIARTITWDDIQNKPSNIVTTDDSPSDKEILYWDSTSGEWLTTGDYVYVSTTPSDGESIVWESASSSWITTTISGGTGSSGPHASTHEDGGTDLIDTLSSLTINASGSSNPGLVVNSHSSATGTTILQEWKDWSGNPVARLLSDGTLYCKAIVSGAIVEFTPMLLNPISYWDGIDSSFDIVDTNRVSNWYDLSGNSYTMAAVDSARRPIRGSDYVEFETGDYLSIGNVDLFSNTNGMTIFVVTTPHNSGTLLSHYYAGGGQRGYLARSFYWNVQENNGGFSSGTTVSISANYNKQVLTYLWEPGARGPVYRNGSMLGNIGVVNDISSTTSVTIAKDGEGNWFDGYIYSMIVYDYALNDTDRGKVENYLYDKYSIS